MEQGKSENLASMGARVARVARLSDHPDRRWCILSTSGGKTLPLARSLAADGIEAWAPVRTIRRPGPGQRRALHLGLRRRLIEVDLAILPGFVFVWGEHLDDLARMTIDPAHQLPGFTVLQSSGHAALIGDAKLAGLREEELAAAVAVQEMRDAETREQGRRVKAEQMRTERARRVALRRERRDFAEGDEVGVINMPSMTGMIGTVESSTGTRAKIHFGGTLTIEVEAWQVIPSALLDLNATA